MLPNQEVIIKFTAKVDPNCAGAPNPLVNQSAASGVGTGLNGMPQTVTDLSDSGTDAEGNNPGQPGDMGTPDDPLVLNLPSITSRHP